MRPAVTIQAVSATEAAPLLNGLSTLLADTVAGGASIGFLAPCDAAQAQHYWLGVFDALLKEEVWLWVAREGEQVVGTVQLAPAMRANGRNRAEVQKLMVLRGHRGQGVAGLLMAAVEETAQAHSRTLLYLDTEAGSAAEAFYRSHGYTRAGEIPDFAASPLGALHPTAIYFKRLGTVAETLPATAEKANALHSPSGPILKGQAMHTHVITLRPATLADAAAIADIYNPYIATTVISFELEPVSAEEMASRIDKVLAAGLPWLVAEVDGDIVGYAYASPWRVRAAYRESVETSVYLDSGHQSRGLGSRLYHRLIEQLRERDFYTAIGGIALPNGPSVALHERMGYRRVAVFEQVGHKFGRRIDVGYWQLML